MSDEEKKVDAPESEAKEEQTPEAEPAKEETKEEAPKEEVKEEAPAEEPAKEEVPAEEVAAPEAEAAPEKQEEKPADYRSKIVGADDLRAGMTVRLHEKIKDISPKGEERERIQVFEGMILGIRGAGISRTVTLRKVSKGYGVEKIYPLNSPLVDKIEVMKIAKVRRAKLGYLKNPKRRFKRKLKETLVTVKQGGKKKKKKK